MRRARLYDAVIIGSGPTGGYAAKALTEALRQLQEQSIDALLEAREDRILAYGRYKEIPAG